MSNDKYEVTVYDRTPSTARVSVAKVDAYLRRTGWGMRCKLVDGWSEWWSPGAEHWVEVPPSVDFRQLSAQLCIERIAECERRQPSAVLADIARELDG